MLVLTLLLRWLAALFGARSRPVKIVEGLEGRARDAFARILERYGARGRALMYEGEDEEAVARRLERAAWIARDPVKAFRHLIRSVRGLMRARLGGIVAPPDFAPPAIIAPALRLGAPGPMPIPDS